MAKRTIVLELDEDDWNTIQNELARRQAFRDEDGMISPESASNIIGSALAECVRDLEEYRDLYESDRPINP